MKIKRFVAKDMRTALTEVKEFLGPDAIILSNKKVAEGVEIVAAIDPESQNATAHKPAQASAQPVAAWRRWRTLNRQIRLSRARARTQRTTKTSHMFLWSI